MIFPVSFFWVFSFKKIEGLKYFEQHRSWEIQKSEIGVVSLLFYTMLWVVV